MCDLGQRPAPGAVPSSGEPYATGTDATGTGATGTGATGAGAPGTGAAAPGSASEATAMVLAGLEWLASADVTSLPTVVQAEVLRGLEQALSVHTAARSKVLSVFTAQAGHEDDGQGSPRTWLTWQTRVTRIAASAAVAWMRRLRAHPAIGDALAARQITQSWARQLCDWTDQLPEDTRADADVILLAATAGGADLDDLASLADQIRRRVAQPDKDDGDDGFEDRRLWLSTTFDGAGTLHGDLTPGCAAALRAVLDALGKKADRSDLRSKAQRDHDALEEACRRLIAANCLPDRAGQPTTIVLHTTPDDFLGHARNTADPGGPGSQVGDGTPGRDGNLGGSGDEGGASRASASSSRRGAWNDSPAGDPDEIPRPAWPGPAARLGDLCDARIIPLVTGQVNHDLLDQLAASLLDQLAGNHHADAGPAGPDTGPARLDTSRARPGTGPPGTTMTHADVRELLLSHAIALLSGPGGLASLLRTGTLPRPAGSVSLPLDIGSATDTIPPHLRRAVIARDRHCAAPGCDQPPTACDVHHIIPRARNGPTNLTNMVLLCRFHHHIYVHEWGWTITLNPDGTTTATSPDRTRQYHSHAPPTAA